jgi:hypothetical protein
MACQKQFEAAIINNMKIHTLARLKAKIDGVSSLNGNAI